MGRWTQYDEDDYRLPDGMKRVGYDADTGKHYFRDSSNGVLYSSDSEYGHMTPEADGPSFVQQQETEDTNLDLEAAPTRADGYAPLAMDGGMSAPHPGVSPYRQLFPFFLIMAVVLLLMWRYVISPLMYNAERSPCAEQATLYVVEPGDSCWGIAQSHELTLDKLMSWNPRLKCDPLMPGSSVCLPLPTSQPSES